jgi:hypothetical protein
MGYSVNVPRTTRPSAPPQVIQLDMDQLPVSLVEDGIRWSAALAI